MNELTEIPYLLALIYESGMTNEEVNRFLIKVKYENKTSLSDLFREESENRESSAFLKDIEKELVLKAAKKLTNYTFMTEDLINQGYHLIPVFSEKYPRILKNNLKIKHSPPLIFAKGDISMFNLKSIAIVGSRNAGDQSKVFVDNIVSANSTKVIVSGGAKGVDLWALEKTIELKGKSIIVLPQGITTYSSGYRNYYREILSKKLLVVSVFHPDVKWSVALAMKRNSIIFGLAENIYVAESGPSGGTWSGVIDGLRKGRKIFIRMPNSDEKNANHILIEKGCIPMDIDCKILSSPEKQEVGEKMFKYSSNEEKIRKLLEKDGMTLTEIKTHFKGIGIKKIENIIRSMSDIEMVVVGNRKVYMLKTENKLFFS